MATYLIRNNTNQTIELLDANDGVKTVILSAGEAVHFAPVTINRVKVDTTIYKREMAGLSHDRSYSVIFEKGDVVFVDDPSHKVVYKRQ